MQVEISQDLFASRSKNKIMAPSRHGHTSADVTGGNSSDSVSSPGFDDCNPSDKKVRHKKVEQNRRETTKALVTELQEMIPSMEHFAPGTNMNVVLEGALDYVRSSRTAVHCEKVPERRIKEEPEEVLEAAQKLVVQNVGACNGLNGLRYASAFQNAPFGIVISRLDGTMLRCNKMFARMLAWQKPEINGQTMFSLTLPSDLPETLQAVSSLLTGSSQSVLINKRCFTENGEIFQANVQITIVHKDGKPSHFMCYLRGRGPPLPSQQIKMLSSPEMEE